ncbi:MAG: hypothetical protein ACOYK4_03840 [Candidatus Planktophila sp.]
MITLEISLRHLAWSNQKFFTLFDEMPEKVFSLRSADNEWTVGEIATILKQHGFHINLNELDVRTYVNETEQK